MSDQDKNAAKLAKMISMAMAVSPVLHPEQVPKPRACGACSLCCKLLCVEQGIEVKDDQTGEIVKREISFFKPEFEWCQHFKKGVGCSIYATRPWICKDYSCLWLMGQIMPEHSPRRIRVIASPNQNEKILTLTEDAPGLAQEHFGAAINEWVKRGITVIIASPGGGRIAQSRHKEAIEDISKELENPKLEEKHD
jgi:Fe-S-cluster containining protein